MNSNAKNQTNDMTSEEFDNRRRELEVSDDDEDYPMHSPNELEEK